MSALDDLARRIRDRGQPTTKPTVRGGASGTAPAASPGMRNPMRALGDLIRGGTDGAAVRLPAGPEGYVLTMAGGIPQWRPATVSGDAVVDNDLVPVTDNDGDPLYTI